MGKALQGFVVVVFCAALLFSKENAQRMCLANSWSIFNSRQEAIKLGNGEESIWGEKD